MAQKVRLHGSFFFVVFLVCSFLTASNVYAGTFQLLYQKNGPDTSGYLGSAVAGAGDVNGDGKADFIVGAPYLNIGGSASAGAAFVYSGADGSLLYEKDGTASYDYFGYAVAGIGDVDGDGKPDFAIGAPNAGGGGTVYVYSGVSGLFLYQKVDTTLGDWLGSSVAGVGDVNGDGKDDFIVGAPYASPGGHSAAGFAVVYSGVDGTVLYQKDDTTDFDNYGYAVAGAGDVDGDGKRDFIVGAPYTAVGGSVYVYSGAADTLLYHKDGAGSNDLFGSSVAVAGDVNGDGKADFIIGAPGAAPGGTDVTGAAYVYSGANGSILYQKDGGALSDDFGFSVAGIGDVDGDGKSDFLIGARYADSVALDVGSASLYSGGDGSLLFQKYGAAADDHLGYAVAAAGDVNGDGRPDLIIGAEATDPGGMTDAGSAYVYGLVATGAPEVKTARPSGFELSQNYPNPFNPATSIRYALPQSAKTNLEIFNLLGERVRTLVNGEQGAGAHVVVWDGRGEKGENLPSGIYFFQLKSKDFLETKKMILLK